MPNEAIASAWTVILVGRHSSGKSTLARALRQVTGAHICELGSAVRRKRLESESLVAAATRILEADPLSLARDALHRADNVVGPRIFVGPRTAVEVHYLLAHSLVDSALTVGINATPELRRERWAKRHLVYADLWDDRELQESLWETEKVIQECDIVVRGDRQLTSKVGNILKYISGQES